MLPVALTTSLPPTMIAAFVAGGAWVSTLTTLNVAMQLRSPEEILGRCLSIYQAVTFGAMALGAYTLGLVADLSSLPVAMLGAAGSLLLSALVLSFVRSEEHTSELQSLMRISYAVFCCKNKNK